MMDAPIGISFAEIVAKDIPEPRWVIPGILAEGLTLLAGKPKMGKSWFGLGLGVAIASGGIALGQFDCEPGEVAYLALEDTERRMRKRLIQMLDGSEAPSAAQFFTSWARIATKKGDGIRADGLDNLRAWLEAHPKARLVVIDTLQKIRPRQKENGSIYAEDYEALTGLKALADRYHVAIVVIHHVRKAESEDVFDTVSGSTGLTGAADSVWVLTRSRGQSDAVLHITGRDVEEQDLALEFDAKRGWWTVLGDADEFRKSEERMEVRKLLRERPGLSAKEISVALGKGYDGTRRLLWKMAGDGDVKQYGNKYSVV